MEKRFVIPASTMLIGIITWLVLFFTINPAQIFQELLLGVLVGALLIVSAFTCRKAGGPRSGNVFRTIILIILAGLSYWFIGIISGSILIASAIITILIAVNTKQVAVS